MKRTNFKFESLILVVIFSVLIACNSNRTKTDKEKIASDPDEAFMQIGKINVDSLFVFPAKKVPQDYSDSVGFYSYSVMVPGVLIRSGQPLIEEYKWLKEQGLKSVIDLRIDDEYGQIALDTKIPGFNELGFKFFNIPVEDGEAPTEEKAIEFLNLIQDKSIQPALIHCRSGVGRTGAMAVLYRYSIEGWTMSKAIEESRNFKNGVNEQQTAFLKEWAKKYPPGSFKKD